MSPELLFDAVILGLVEGATEFIPVSSTGHLIVVGEWLGQVGDRAKTFDIFIQLGAILAIVWLYRARLTHAVLAARSDPKSRRFLLNLLIAFLPAALVGFLVHDWLKEHLFRMEVVAGALVVGGILILLIERWRPRVRHQDVMDIPARTALGVGLAQVLSLVPGTSRSGATIMGGYLLGTVAHRRHRVLLLPRHSGDVRGDDVRPAEEPRYPVGRGRAVLRRGIRRLVPLGARHRQGVPLLRLEPQLRRVRLVPDRVRTLLLLWARWMPPLVHRFDAVAVDHGRPASARGGGRGGGDGRRRGRAAGGAGLPRKKLAFPSGWAVGQRACCGPRLPPRC